MKDRQSPYILGFIFVVLVTLYFNAPTIVEAATTVFNSAQLGGSASNGYVLQTDGEASTWVDPSTFAGSPGGSDTQVQFNDGGSFGGDSGMTFIKGSGAFAVNGELQSVTGNIIAPQGYVKTGDNTHAGSLKLADGSGGEVVIMTSALGATVSIDLAALGSWTDDYIMTINDLGSGAYEVVGLDPSTLGSGLFEPRCRAYVGSDQTVSGAAGTYEVDLTAETYDPDGICNLTTNAITPGVAGYYEIKAQVVFNANAGDTLYQLILYFNGASSLAVNRSGPTAGGDYTMTVTDYTMTVTDVRYFDDDDFVELYFYKGDLTNRTIYGQEYYSFISVTRMGD